LTSLLRDDSPIHKQRKFYIKNVLDHVIRMEQKLKLSRTLLTELSTTYMAKVNIELAEASQRVNLTMRKFGTYGALLMPLTLISGIFGMNVQLPGMIGFPNTPDGYGWFIGIMLMMVTIILFLLIFFRSMKWV